LGSLDFFDVFVSLAVLLFSLTVHEAAHAWTADRLGDPTARLLGRISLNPAVHVDPIGTLLLPLIAAVTGAPLIGWAKPVPVDTRRLGHPRRDFMLVAAAGPASNLVLAVGAALLIRVTTGIGAGAADSSSFAVPLAVMAFAALQVNLLLALFNMIPVPPLDGGNVVGGLLHGRLRDGYESLRPYGVFILYALMLSGAVGAIIGPPYVFLARLLTL
jgi:Zn-dependent protease